jgi:hypothetical protein
MSITAIAPAKKGERDDCRRPRRPLLARARNFASTDSRRPVASSSAWSGFALNSPAASARSRHRCVRRSCRDRSGTIRPPDSALPDRQTCSWTHGRWISHAGVCVWRPPCIRTLGMLRHGIGGASRGTYVIILANVVSSVSSQGFCTGLSVSSLKEGRGQPRCRSRLNATRAVDGTARFITVWQGWS